MEPPAGFPLPPLGKGLNLSNLPATGVDAPMTSRAMTSRFASPRVGGTQFATPRERPMTSRLASSLTTISPAKAQWFAELKEHYPHIYRCAVGFAEDAGHIPPPAPTPRRERSAKMCAIEKYIVMLKAKQNSVQSTSASAPDTATQPDLHSSHPIDSSVLSPTYLPSPEPESDRYNTAASPDPTQQPMRIKAEYNLNPELRNRAKTIAALHEEAMMTFARLAGLGDEGVARACIHLWCTHAFEHMLRLQYKLHGENSVEAAATEWKIAELYTKQHGQEDRAAQLYESCLAKRLLIYGEGSAEVEDAEEELATSYMEQDRADAAALVVYEPWLQTRTRLFGAESPQCAEAQECVARCYKEQGRIDEALVIFMLLRERQAMIFGEDSPEVADVANEIADAINRV